MTDIINKEDNESFEGIFGKGILLIVILTVIFYLLFGGYNISWDDLEKSKLSLVIGGLLFYIWHFKLVYDDRLYQINKSFNTMFSYALLNIIVAAGFNTQYVIAFIMYQALLINGYNSSVYYKGLMNLKENIEKGRLNTYARQILENKNK